MQYLIVRLDQPKRYPFDIQYLARRDNLNFYCVRLGVPWQSGWLFALVPIKKTKEILCRFCMVLCGWFSSFKTSWKIRPKKQYPEFSLLRYHIFFLLRCNVQYLIVRLDQPKRYPFDIQYLARRDNLNFYCVRLGVPWQSGWLFALVPIKKTKEILCRFCMVLCGWFSSFKTSWKIRPKKGYNHKCGLKISAEQFWKLKIKKMQ